jgi:transposase InsO family protein
VARGVTCAGRARTRRSGAGIKRIHADSDGTYGRPRITAELRETGVAVNHKRVGRVMRRVGITGLHLRKKVRTTVPEPSAAPVPDLIERDFTAQAPNTRYVGDITYLPVGDGKFLYLATVIDLYSRRLAGFSIAEHMRTDLVTDALRAAAATRGGNLQGAIFHSDNGAQGGFNWSSQRLDSGGVRWAGTQSWSGCPKGRVGSGRRTGR